MLSPGIGLQQPLRLALISAMPSTKTSLFFILVSLCELFSFILVAKSGFSSSFLFIIFIIDIGVCLPRLISTYNSSISLSFSSFSIISIFLLDKNSFILIFSFLNSFSNNSDPFSIFSSFSNLL